MNMLTYKSKVKQRDGTYKTIEKLTNPSSDDLLIKINSLENRINEYHNTVWHEYSAENLSIDSNTGRVSLPRSFEVDKVTDICVTGADDFTYSIWNDGIHFEGVVIKVANNKDLTTRSDKVTVKLRYRD